MPKHPKKANDDRSDPGALPRQSFEEFYEEHRPRYEERLSREIPEADAKDLAQEVFISVWLAQRVRKMRNLAGVVARAIKNARVDQYRKQRARQTYEGQFARECESLQAAPSGIESAALRAERLRLLEALRTERPDAYRAYILRRYSELEFSEIADVMGIGRNKASKLVRIALIQLHSAGAGEDNL